MWFNEKIYDGAIKTQRSDLVLKLHQFKVGRFHGFKIAVVVHGASSWRLNLSTKHTTNLYCILFNIFKTFTHQEREK